MTRGPLAAVLFLTILAPARAQPATYLYGRVLDPTEAAVPGAAVTVVDQNAGFRRIAESGTDGSFLIPSLRPSLYKVTVRKQGFRTMIRFNVRLGAARPVRADFLLSIGDMQETITVEGTAPLLHEQDAAVGTRLSFDEIQAASWRSGGLLNLLELTPGVVITPATRGEPGQFTANGQRPNAHSFTVDGVSANLGLIAGGLPAQPLGGTLPALNSFGSLDAVIPVESVDELHIQTSTTAAEHGRLPGAGIALSSRAGSNDWHGSLLTRWRPEALTANDWFANAAGLNRPDQSVREAAAALGGPILRNRLFFFLSGEAIRLYQPLVWREAVPSLALRESAPAWVRPALDQFPLPNGPTLGGGLALSQGARTQPARLNAYSVRLDHALTSRVNWFARWSQAPSANEFGAFPVNRLFLDSRSLTTGLRVQLTPGLTLETRLNQARARVDSSWMPGLNFADACVLQPIAARFLGANAGCASLVRVSIGGAGQVAAGREGLREQRQFQWAQSLSWTRGPHTVRAGADLLRVTPIRADAAGSVMIRADTAADLVSTTNFWSGWAPAQQARLTISEASLWAQDSWRMTPRLTVNAGLRWEFSPAPTPANEVNFLDELTSRITPERRALWHTSYRNFAPRLGLAWRLSQGGRTVLRAGAGLYYSASLMLGTDVLNGGPLNLTQFASGRYAPFPSSLQYGFLPGLRLPQVVQWNVSLDQGLTKGDAMTVSYVGSAGHGLIRREIGSLSGSDTFLLALATNRGSSDYHGLQIHYRRTLSRGIGARASYTWSHSMDTNSSDATLAWRGLGASAASDRGSSDFDVRHAFTAAAFYEVPRTRGSAIARALGGWALDGIVSVRSGFPLTVLQNDQFLGIQVANAFRPDWTGTPLWSNDHNTPGGRRLRPTALVPIDAQGNLGRNALTGFGMWQVDAAVRREFRAERFAIQVRLEALNVLNHASFADPIRFLTSPLFGQSNAMRNRLLGSGSPGSGLAPQFQSGGPRSLQLSVRLQF